MKNLVKITAIAAGLSASTALAGTSYSYSSKAPAMVPPPLTTYGEGSYFGLQGGFNFYQSYEGTERRRVNGNSLSLEVREKIGGFGGIKWGYGWLGEGVSPAIELDAFYNGADYTIDARGNGTKFGSATGRLDSGAALLNGIIRFGTPESAFKPYVGIGVGAWLGQVSDSRLTNRVTGESIRVGSNDTTFAFAAQALAGFDYFVTPNMSLFTEYKYLNYWGADFGFSGDRVGQHLLGFGLRYFY